MLPVDPTNDSMSGSTVPGTFQHYLVSFTRYLTPIPEGLDMAEAAPVLCAGVTVLNGLKACQLSFGNWVAVPGAGGGLGHLAVQYAIAAGMKVVGIDTGPEKKKLVEGYGGVFIDFKEEKVDYPSTELTHRISWLLFDVCRMGKVSTERSFLPLRKELTPT